MSRGGDRIAAELLALKDEDGKISASEAVAWAREHPDSELHQRLTWDDAVAGEKYRVWEVRQLLIMHVLDNSGERRFISLTIDRTEEGGGYRSMPDVLRDQNLREVLLQDAFAELERVRRKFEHLRELADVWAALDRAKERRGRRERPRRRPPDEDGPRPSAS